MLEKALINSTVDIAIQRLKEYGKISDSEIEQFRKASETQNLVIGVVGKMKAGKSSLVNAAIFGDNILPSGPQPVTVTLTEISYSETEDVKIILLTPDDILDLKNTASYNGDNPLLIEKANNAKITLNDFPKDYENLIAGKQSLSISLSELEQFVSSNGKYSGLAKQVQIQINNESLKGITIIDTPGFNDPISSRGETTCKCLSRCNVILFVHNEDGYDQIDEELLRCQIEYAGISDMIDIFNRVDLLHMPFSEWEDQKEYFIEKRKDYLDKIPDSNNVHNIAAKAEAILTSSLMALCGIIPPEKRSNWIKVSRSNFEEEYNEFSDFSDDISLNNLFIKYSNINSITTEINRIARNSASYLLEAPLKTLKGKLDSVIENTKSEIEECNAKVSSYNASIKSAKQEIEDIENYISSVLSEINNYPLEEKIQYRISKTFTNLCSVRSQKSGSEFSKENYPEPGTFTQKVKKQNVAQYNLYVSNFEDIIRDEMNDLINSLKSIINEYVGDLTMMLVESKISEDNRKLFKQGLINELSGMLNMIIVIDSHVIDKAPIGQQMQWSLFKTNFERTFSDSYFNNLLDESIRQKVGKKDGLCDPSIPKYKIINLLDSLKEVLALSPEEKEQAKKNELQIIENRKQELELYKDSVKRIESLLKS